jgi:hypothetical protein
MCRDFVRVVVRCFAVLFLANSAFAQITPPTIVKGAMGALERQTGYFPQLVSVTNPGPDAYPGLRILVNDLPKDTETNIVRVANAHGFTNTVIPYFDFGPIAAGATVTFRVEFYVSNRLTLPDPNYAGIVQPKPLTPLAVAFVVVTNATYFQFHDGTNAFYSTFNTERDRFYYVQYSTNLVSTNWLTSLPAIRGTGSGVVWVDTGPPRTESLPTTNGSRFYRVIALP